MGNANNQKIHEEIIERLVEKATLMNNKYTDEQLVLLVSSYPALVSRIFDEFKYHNPVNWPSFSSKSCERRVNLLQDLDEASITWDQLFSGLIATNNAKVFDAFANPSHDEKNAWVLWYDTSPEVTALWKQMEAEAHQRFRQQYLGK